MSTVIGLDEPEATDGRRCGSKAATLARLRQAGYDVPDGVILRGEHLAPEAGDPGDMEAPDGAPEPVVAAIDASLQRLGEGRFAVRSSAAAEDLTGASFAGMYESVLGVSGRQQLVEAVRSCLESAASSPVSAYRKAGGDGDRQLPSLLLQRLVEAEQSGIAFSADPVTGERDCVRISAVSGLGDRLASGESDAEEWMVRSGAAERSAAGPDGPVLDDSKAVEIAELARRLERDLGVPQDIEWAIEAGRLRLLQSRPITALPTPPAEELPGAGWQKDQVHHPEPITPFGASVYLDPLSKGSTAMCESWGLVIGRAEQRSVGGEVYMRMDPVVGPSEPKGRKAPPAFLLGLIARIHPRMRRRMRTAERVMEEDGLTAALERWYSEWKPEITESIDRMWEVDLGSLGDEELVDHLSGCRQLLERGQWIHFQLFVPYVVRLHELHLACSELLGWDDDQTMRLLAGSSGQSVAPSEAMAALAASVADPQAAIRALDEQGSDPVGALEPIDPQAAGELERWLHEYGRRCVNYDPGSPTLGEDPATVAGHLRSELLRASRGPRTAAQSGPEHAEAAAREARSRLAGEALERFEATLEAARTAYPVREENVAYTDHAANGAMRRWLLEAGSRLVERGAIARLDDAAYLTAEEIVSCLRGEPGVDPAARADRRRGERAWVRSHPGPPVIGEPDAPPDASALPDAGRRVNAALLWIASLEFPIGHDAGGEGIVTGTAGSPGTYTGPVRVITGEEDFPRLREGDVLVCPVTTPAWTMLFSKAGALVTDGGGVLSHAAIVAREHGIPAVLGTRDATTCLTDGQVVTVDGTSGKVVAG